MVARIIGNYLDSINKKYLGTKDTYCRTAAVCLATHVTAEIYRFLNKECEIVSRKKVRREIEMRVVNFTWRYM